MLSNLFFTGEFVMDRIALLKKVGLFSNLSEAHLSSIAEFCVERSFRMGCVIIKQGNSGIGLYVICSGKVKIVKETAGGEKLDFAELGPGDFFGEMTVLDSAPRSADVIALEESKCLVLSAWDFNARMKVDPEIALKILPVVVKRFRETNERLLALSPS
jgi:CRP/FNR family cyclic AMP-dependent transcriptional regulator